MVGRSDDEVRSPRGMASPPPGEEVVIAGIAGRFPESDNMRHFEENLLSKKDLVTSDDRRWKLDHPEIPQRTGKINNVGKFDALFFGVHFKQAHTMDPMNRMLMEHTYEAIVDAGINPRQLRGSRTGVFIGACFSESEKTWFYEKLQVNGFGITGCSRAMLANRISYWLGVTGPSYTVDSACSSSLFAMEHAYRAIRSGMCDSAIVGGSNLCLHPYVSLQFSRLGVLSPDGCCKSFDVDANGYVRSEAVAVVFLQRAKDAKRVYATLVHGKVNCDGFKEQGITFPSSVMQSVLLQEFYEECGIPPSILGYVEAHGTGTKVGDPEEVNALDKVFCPGRTTPLRIGAVKSNLGHSEPASGLCSIAKVVIAMETGYLPPNLHYKQPREGVKALENGRIQVISEKTPWEGGYVGVNSFGFGGANAHILLKSNAKEKVNGGAPDDDLPRLVAVSGRTEEAAAYMLNDITSRPVDVEYIRLFHDIHAEEIPSHMYRGYAILPPRGVAETPLKEIQHYPGAKRPIWFVFSGMGSQWPGMGEALMQLPIFAEAVKKCHAVLKPRGVDIYDILTNRDRKTFDNILNSFVGIATVQIGLVDVLRSVGIVPDGIIGHSVGELGCAYADGCFTAEQMVLAAYSRGLASIETKVVFGSMAAVGLGYDDVKDLCPPDIEVACHNGPDSSTISGPAESMKVFVAKLQANKIFAREVPCSNIPYHSRYIAPAGPKLLAYLQQVITDPKPRSQKWKSSSVPRSEWSSPLARLSSAEYHTNNLLSPVLFEETATLIPKNAVTIEIAPHGLLQAILRRSLHEGVTNIAMTKRGHENNVQMVLQALGKLFLTGLHPDLRNLYPEVRYPVSRGTPMISPLIKWEHSEDWYVTSYRMQEKIVSGERVVELEMADETYEYMQGHVIDGRVLVPAIGYLSLIWETVGMMLGQLFTEVSVLFEDVKFIRATSMPSEGKIEFTLMVQKGTGRFEVIEGGAAIVTGMVHTVTDPSRYKIKIPPTSGGEKAEEGESMSSDDFYKELRLRGYQYSGQFRSVKEASFDGSEGKIDWANNWVTFMDNMLQLKIIGMDTRGLFVPTGIQELLIDTKTHLNQIRTMPDDEKVFPVKVYKHLDTLVSGGVQIRGMTASAIARRKPVGDPVLEEYKFVPHIDRTTTTTLSEAVRLATHVALENHLILKFKTIEVVADTEEAKVEELLSPLILDILGDIPLLQADVSVATSPDKFTEGSLPDNIFVTDFKKLAPEQNAAIAVGRNLIQGGLESVLPLLKEGGFVLSRETSKDGHDGSLPTRPRGAGALMDVILERRTDQGERLVLLRKRDRLPRRTEIVQVRNDDFDWLPSLKKILKSLADKESTGQTKVLLVGQGDFECGLLGLVNCLRKEPGGEAVRAVLIQDAEAPGFDLENPLYAERMPLDLAVDVLRPGGIWGSYRHLPLPALEHVPVHHAFVNQSVRGDLTSLQWYAGPITPEFRHKDLIRVLYAPMNFRDVMLATGKLATEVVAKNRQQQESSIGFEFCGIDPAGRRVMGLTSARGMTNLLVADRLLSWVVPDDWTMEDAATVPCVYATCYYAFYVHGHLKKGERVLIHAGSGGVGQAAITMALHEGCEVFTTVGTPEKRRFIRERFPRIDDSHIGNSRDTSFEQMIMTETNGRGVDIVLNSLSEDKLQASVRCLAERGRFLEIGKFDLAANNQLGMRIFLKEVSFHGVMVDHLFEASDEAKAELWKVMDKGLRSGAIKPLTRVVFEKDQLETAFRYMAGGKHIGKVIIKVRDEGEAPNAGIAAVPYFQCLEERSYVILGGLGGFGLELADWLVLRGARNLVLTSRTGISNGYQRSRIHLWKSYGARVLVVVGKDASKSADCREILESAAKLGPVDGIFNLAVQLRDNLLENQTEKAFEESFVGKARSTKRLDELSRTICPKLRHFVVFSSISCGRGNGGQTNYGMANSVMERICEKRVADGLPGLAVQWGAVGDVGLVAAMAENRKELSIGGTLRQGITSCLQELDGFLHRGCPIVSSMVVAEKRAGGSGSTDVVGTVLNIMGLKDLKTVSHHTSLAELGMDSIMAVEIKQTLEREFEIFLTAQDIRALNFAKLIEMAKREAEQGKTKKKIDGDSLVGMKLLVRILGDEELDLNAFLNLETKAEMGRSEVFLIPGVEGFGTIFKDLASKLKCPACCLQLGIGRPEDDSIDDMVDHLLPDFLARNKDRRNFFLVGYSFGAVIAIELARRLEAEGLSGRLLLIDGAPDQLKALGDQHLPATTEEEVQNNVLLGMMDLLAPVQCPELVVQLDKYNIWEEKLEAFMTIIPDSVSRNMSPAVRRGICTSVYKRLSAVRKYDSSALPPIRSPIILLKPTMPALKSSAEDYGLGKITRDTVEVHYLQGNHLTIIENEKVATAINGEPLEDAESFKQRIMEDGKILTPITLSEQQRS